MVPQRESRRTMTGGRSGVHQGQRQRTHTHAPPPTLLPHPTPPFGEYEKNSGPPSSSSPSATTSTAATTTVTSSSSSSPHPPILPRPSPSGKEGSGREGSTTVGAMGNQLAYSTSHYYGRRLPMLPGTSYGYGGHPIPGSPMISPPGSQESGPSSQEERGDGILPPHPGNLSMQDKRERAILPSRTSSSSSSPPSHSPLPPSYQGGPHHPSYPPYHTGMPRMTTTWSTSSNSSLPPPPPSSSRHEPMRSRKRSLPSSSSSSSTPPSSQDQGEGEDGREEEQDEVVEKRKRNTEAARRSRARKVQAMQQVQQDLQEARLQYRELEQRFIAMDIAWKLAMSRGDKWKGRTRSLQAELARLKSDSSSVSSDPHKDPHTEDQSR